MWGTFTPNLDAALSELITATLELFSNQSEPLAACKFNALVVVSGLGVAKSIVDEEGDVTWDLVSEITSEIVSTVRSHAVALNRTGKLRVTSSLARTIDQLTIAFARNSGEGDAFEWVTPDMMLLSLAGHGNAQLVLVDNEELVWTITANVLVEFKSVTRHDESDDDCQVDVTSIGEGAKVKLSLREKVRMDETLQKVVAWRSSRIAAQSPEAGSPDEVFMHILAVAEFAGEAIPYIDVDGELAWKASEQFMQELVGDDDDDDNDNDNDDNDSGDDFDETDYDNDNDDIFDGAGDDDADDNDDLLVPVYTRVRH